MIGTQDHVQEQPQGAQPVGGGEGPSCNAREGECFESQYAQRTKAKRLIGNMVREKRRREQAYPIQLGLFRKPCTKVVKKQDQRAQNVRYAFATLDVRK